MKDASVSECVETAKEKEKGHVRVSGQREK